jgi:hypothetical protein
MEPDQIALATSRHVPVGETAAGFERYFVAWHTISVPVSGTA